MSTQPSNALETFANPSAQRDYTIRIRVPEFNVRGGIYATVVVEHRADGWQAAEPVVLP